MSAEDHLAPRQLAMFMPARQIYAEHNLGDDAANWGDGDSPISKSQTILRKHHENVKYGAPDMGEPITIDHNDYRPLVDDGHHRLALGIRTNAELPLQHIDEDNPLDLHSHAHNARMRQRKLEEGY